MRCSPAITLTFLLSACGAVVAPPPSHDPVASDVPAAQEDPRDGGAATDVPVSDAPQPARDVATAPRSDVPAPPTPPACSLAGPWRGWWSYRESGHGETRSAIGLQFAGNVSGQGVRPSGAITRGALSRDGAVSFTVGEMGHSVGFGFIGQLTGCDAMRGSYATHSYGGSFELQRLVCTAAVDDLNLDDGGVEGNLSNAPLEMVSDCDRTAPSLHHAFKLRVPQRMRVRVWLDAQPSVDLAVSLRAGCDAPDESCARPGQEIIRELEAGTYRVVVSSLVTRGVRYLVRAASIVEPR